MQFDLELTQEQGSHCWTSIESLRITSLNQHHSDLRIVEEESIKIYRSAHIKTQLLHRPSPYLLLIWPSINAISTHSIIGDFRCRKISLSHSGYSFSYTLKRDNIACDWSDCFLLLITRRKRHHQHDKICVGKSFCWLNTREHRQLKCREGL